MDFNTGIQEREQRDVNPTSPTFGQLRWITNGLNLAACPLPAASFRSLAISATVYRDDCGAGTSSGVLYTVPAGQIVSQSAQSDADTLARDYFNATSQAYARANAICRATGREVWLLSVAFSAQQTRLEISTQRTDTSGTLSINVAYQIAGVNYTATVSILDGATSGFNSRPRPPATSGLETIDTASITSVTPNTYVIRP